MTTGHGPFFCGWQMKVSTRPACASMSIVCSITVSPDVCFFSGPVGHAVALLRINHGDHAHAAAFAVRPAPWERHESATLAGHGIQFAAYILDSRNAVAHEDLVRRLPVRKVVQDVAPGRGFIF